MWELLTGHFLVKIGSVTAALLATRAGDLWWRQKGRDCTDPSALLKSFSNGLIAGFHSHLHPEQSYSFYSFLSLCFSSFFLNYKKMLCTFKQLSSSLLSEWAVLARLCLKSWKKGFELSLARCSLHLGLLTTCGGCVWTNPSILSASVCLSSRLLLRQWRINQALSQMHLFWDWITKSKLLLFLAAVWEFGSLSLFSLVSVNSESLKE